MIFIESSCFTADVRELLSDDEYAELQQFLAVNPHAGVLIEDTGGLRKVRWRALGRGKSGGVRVIYYHLLARDQIRMLVIYRKGVKDDLSASEKQTLRALNRNW